MTQMSKAMDGVLTPEMEEILKKENLSEAFLIQYIKAGKIAIIPSKTRNNHIAIGDGLTSKILSNIGTSSNSIDSNKIFEFVKIVEKNGASIICDQSSGPNFFQHREKLLRGREEITRGAINGFINKLNRIAALDIMNERQNKKEVSISFIGISFFLEKLINLDGLIKEN